MTITHKQRVLALAGVALISTFLVLATTSYAHAHDGEVHSAEHTLRTTEGDRIETMKKLVSLLEELRVLLELKAERAHDHKEQVASLSISVEEHGGRTHIHVYEEGTQTDAFFLDGLTPSQEDAVISAIAERTDFDEEAVREAAAFPTSEHEEHEDAQHDEEQDLSGIHIMGDGTVMLGDGTILEDATVTEGGMIELANGTLVEPELDMR